MGLTVVKLIDNPVQLNFTGGINPTGEYDNGTAYVTGDSVSYLESSYVAIQNTTGNLPTNTTYWQVLAIKGEDGEPGVGVGGQGVPAGGLTGQTLGKNSNTDYDIEWQTLDDLDDTSTTHKFTSIVEKRTLRNSSSTGLIYIDACSVNVDNTKWNIGAGSCRIIDNYTDASNPVETVVTWTAQTGLTPQNLGTSTWESFGINLAGTLLYVADDSFSFEDKRDVCSIGYVTHENMTTIDNVHAEPVMSTDVSAKVEDHLYVEGHKIYWGHVASPLSGLTIRMSEGIIFGPAINEENNPKDPNFMPTTA